MKKTAFFTVLKNNEFLKLWGGQLLSLVCAHMLVFILMGKIYQETSSAIAVALFWGFFILPSVTLGPFTGVFLDFINKKKVLVFSSLSQAVIVLLYLGINQRIWLFYPVILLYSLLDEFFTPAVGVLIPSVVKKHELPAANSLFLFTTQGGLALGFLLGGLLLKFLNFTKFPFVLTSILLLVSSFSVYLLNWKEKEREKEIKTSLSGFWEELLRGYTFIKNEPKILFPMILLTGLQIILGTAIILLPSISKTLLRIDFADSSILLIIPAIFGAILGSFLTERLLVKYLKRVLVVKGLLFLGFLVLVLGTISPFFKIPGLLGSLFAFGMGICFIMMFVPLQILIQENTPFSVRGRVFGTLNTLITIAAAIPVLTAVTLVDFLGIGLVLTLIGFGLISLAFYASVKKNDILPSNYRS